MVMDASFEISGTFTTTLSSLMSYNQSNHAGTLSLGFCLNCCTKSINSAAVYGRAVTRRVLWEGATGQRAAPLAYPVFFFLFFFFFFFFFWFCFVFELQLVGSQRDLALVEPQDPTFSAFIYRVQFTWILLYRVPSNF